MAELLTPADLAFMRETQTEARPTPAVLLRMGTGRGPGGEPTAVVVGDPTPLQVRLWATPDEVPQQLADRYEGGTLVKLALDLLHDVRAGDQLAIPPDAPQAQYELVSEGEPDQWATAQLVWARRLDRPARGA